MANSMGSADFSLDSSLAKNRMVYHGEKCPETVETEDNNDCPAALPARDAQVAGWRYGDLGMTVFDTRWPGRQRSRIDKGMTRLAYIKLVCAALIFITDPAIYSQTTCVKLPVCNSNLTANLMYDGSGASRDCGVSM